MAATEFGIPPHQWDMTPLKSRAEMMAFNQAKGLMSSYQMESDED